MNLFENIGSQMISTWKGDVVHNLENLQEKIRASWTALYRASERSYFQKLKLSMKNRFQAIIDNEGLHITIKYDIFKVNFI